MAIARGAGTEIIRFAHFSDVDADADRKLIIGVQHHIYTVLSIVIYCNAVNAASDSCSLVSNFYDTITGAQVEATIFKAVLAAGETYVWNDKFSFGGSLPTDFGSPPLSTVAEQDAIADQGDSTAQFLHLYSTHASDDYDVNITYLDQNNA
jgi:hypothetical protein